VIELVSGNLKFLLRSISRRDRSKPVYNEEADKYSATITLEKDVTPVYAWFNGFTKAQLPGEPVSRLAGNTQKCFGKTHQGNTRGCIGKFTHKRTTGRPPLGTCPIYRE